MSYPKEPIFKASIRALFVTLFAVAGFFLAFIPIGIIFSLSSSAVYKGPNTELAIAPNVDNEIVQQGGSAPVLLKVNISGMIGIQDLTQQNFKTLLMESREGLLKGDRVKGVLLCIDSPGGSAYDSERMFELVKAYKKQYSVPVFAFVDGMCASGGMYIASAADKIYATKTSLIGSVGVRLGPTFNYYEAMNKLGVQSLTLTQGKDKDALNPFRPWHLGEDDNLQHITKLLYDDFLSAVLSGRPKLSEEKLVNEYGAHIFLGQEAQTIGFVDFGNSDYNEALKALAQASNVDTERPYQVFEIKMIRPFLKDLVNSQASFLRGEIKHSFEIPGMLPEALQSKPLYLYIPN